MSGFNRGAAAYDSHVGSIYVPKKVVTDIYMDYHCDSIMGAIARPDFLANEDLKCFSEVIYPVLEDDDNEDCDQYQANGYSEEIGEPLGQASVRICQAWKFHKKMERGDMARMCDRQDMFKRAMQEYLNRKLDRRVDAYGLAVIAASAAPYNRGNNAGFLSHALRLGDLNAPWVMSTESANDLVNNMLTCFEEADVTCSNAHLKLIVPPIMAAKLRKEQQAINICCSSDGKNPMVSGRFTHSYGFEVLVSNRLPRKVVNGKVVWYPIALDQRVVGAPSELLYMNWQVLGHDAGLFGQFIWDTFVFNGKGIVVGAVTA